MRMAMSQNILLLFLASLSAMLCWSCGSEPAEQTKLLPPPPAITLSELCTEFNTDKCANQHNFIALYEALFAPIRNSATRVFEIGILRGASHRMWQKYFEGAEIFGIDIEDNSSLEKEGIHTFVADQANREDLQGFIDAYPGAFDVILDDGGHAMDHQQVSLGFLFPYVKPGGYFIIEDVHTSLPDFYPAQFFNVDVEESNTTLKMIETYIRTSLIKSQYITEKEANYLQRNIELVSLHYRTNEKHSIVCVIQKKK